MMRHLGSGRWLLLLLLLLAAGCVAPGENLRGLADQPPLDLAVLVTGGAFRGPSSGSGTFSAAPLTDEAIPAATLVEALRRGRVFRRVEIDPDLARRRTISSRLALQRRDDDVHAFLREARAQGFDLLLVIEQLQDGPIEAQGTNGRWPVTLATWLLLGVGLLIPDRTFESRATLRCTMRDLQSGRALLDPPLLFAGPIDLSLVERTDFLGLCQSIVVPPFWVGDDEAVMGTAVRATTESRLLLSLVRELKGESSRRRLREAAPAEIELQDGQVRIWCGEGVADVRLRAPLPAAAAAAFTRELLGSVVLVERLGVRRFHYQALLPALAAGSEVQVLVSTVSGAVASVTAVVEVPR
jgi:hypothetical protein